MGDSARHSPACDCEDCYIRKVREELEAAELYLAQHFPDEPDTVHVLLDNMTTRLREVLNV